MEPYETEEMDLLGASENEAPSDAPPTPEADAPETPEAGETPAAEAEETPAPKRKRASRKKATEPEDAPAEPEEAPTTPEGEADNEAEPPNAAGDGSDALDDALSAPVGAGAVPDVTVMELAEETPEAPEEDDPAEEDLPASGTERRIARPRENRPVNGHAPLRSLDLNELDRNLSREERQEWNDIYASFRAKSILTGEVIGVDPYAFYVRNRATGMLERRRMHCAVVIGCRVKVLIPETEFWMPGEERPSFVFRNLTGAQIDYVILDVDREGGVAIASRRMGADIRRRAFSQARGGHSVGDRLPCRVMTVGPTRCLIECGGFDLTLTRQEMTHTSIYDLRERYDAGQELDCILTAYDRAAGSMEVSVKAAEPDPFDGIENRHPLGSRRKAVITGKYGGGVFCTLPDGTTVLCLYTSQHTDRDFCAGDGVMLVIVKHDTDRRLVYGRILSKR